MEHPFESLKKQLSGELAASARAYLEPALTRCHANRRPDHAQAQALIGNLAAGFELTLKAFLASVNPGLVFKELPLEASVYLYAPKSVPEKFDWTPFDLDLREFRHRTVEFRDAVRAFDVFFPELKILFRPYVKSLSELRGLSLHASLGHVRDEETDKAVYLAVRAAAAVAAHEEAPPGAYEPTPEDGKFLKRYEADREKSVREKLRAAKEKASTLKVDITYNDAGAADDWEAFDARCPVCSNWGELAGWTDIRCEEGGRKESLDFHAYGFHCDACGLALDDVEELKLADMPTLHDRSEDLAKWGDRPEEEAAS